MEIATFNTLHEVESVLNMVHNAHSSSDLDVSGWGKFSYQVGGITTSPGTKNSWYWIDSNRPIDFQLKWIQGEPNNAKGIESCLAISLYWRKFAFNDVPCDRQKNSEPQGFMCRKEVSPQITNIENANIDVIHQLSDWIKLFITDKHKSD